MAKGEDKKSQSGSVNHKAEIIEIEQELSSVNPNIFKGVPPSKKNEIIQAIRKVSITTERHHSGPLPDAETITQYNAVIPNGADRIMQMAEKQQDHRMQLENKAIKHQLSESSRGQIFGFVLCLISLSIAGYLVYTDREISGSLLGGSTIVSLTTIFVLGKKESSPKG